MANITGTYTIEYCGNDIGTLDVSIQGLMTVFDGTCKADTRSVKRLVCLSGENPVAIGIMLPDGDSLTVKKRFSKNSLMSMGLSSIEKCRLIEASLPVCDSFADLFKEADSSEQAPREKKETPVAPEEETSSSNENIISDDEPDAPDISTQSTEEVPDEEAVFDDIPISGCGSDDKSDLPYSPPDCETDMVWIPEKEPSLLFNDEDVAFSCKLIKGALKAENGGITYLAIPISTDRPFPLVPIFMYGNTTEIDDSLFVVFKLKNGDLI